MLKAKPPLGRNAGEGSAQPRRNEPNPARRGPPRPRQPRPRNQRQNNEATRAAPNENEAPRPPTNNGGQRRRRNNNKNNNNRTNLATNPANMPNAANSQPNNRGQQRRQNNPAPTTNPANPPPNATSTAPINPATGQPFGKRAAKRMRAQARAAEAQQRQQGSQSTTQTMTQATAQKMTPTVTLAANQTTTQTRRQRQPQANERSTRAPTAQGSGSQRNPRRALPNPRVPIRASNNIQHTFPRQQDSDSTANDTADDSQLAHVAQATLEHLNRLSLEENTVPTLIMPVFNYDGWSDAFIIDDASAGPESDDDSDEDTEVGANNHSDTRTEDPTESTVRRPVVTSPCSICLDVPDEYPALGPTANCTHDSTICASCLAQHISHAVQSQGSTTLTCPDAECRKPMEYADVIRGAKDDQACLDRYEALLLRRMLENDPKFVWCKNATCGWGQVHDSGEYAPIVICQACHARSCFTHDVPWHTGLTCEQYTAQMENRAAEDRASQEYVQQNTKACPNKSCGRNIEKNDGCDHMTCRLPAGCGHEFCWLCFADYGPIRQEGNHHHAASCRYYAPINGSDPFQSYYLRMAEVQRLRRELYAPPAHPVPPPAHPAPPPGPSQRDRERQARLEDWFRPGPLNPVAPPQPTYRRDMGLPEPPILQPTNPIPRRAPGTPALPAPNPFRAQPPPLAPAPELPTPVRSWWSSVFGFSTNP